MNERAAAAWKASQAYLDRHPGAPAILRQVVYEKLQAIRKREEAQATPGRRVALGGRLEALERACERLCKAIVRRRDLDPDGWGNCVSCGKNSNRLQWGHFIPQHRSPWLRFDPRATAMQCEECNGPGRGMPEAFAAAIDRREKTKGFAAMLEAEAARRSTWQPTVAALEEKKAQLEATMEQE